VCVWLSWCGHHNLNLCDGLSERVCGTDGAHKPISAEVMQRRHDDRMGESSRNPVRNVILEIGLEKYLCR
jgi:hypothetical protein